MVGLSALLLVLAGFLIVPWAITLLLHHPRWGLLGLSVLFLLLSRGSLRIALSSRAPEEAAAMRAWSRNGAAVVLFLIGFMLLLAWGVRLVLGQASPGDWVVVAPALGYFFLGPAIAAWAREGELGAQPRTPGVASP